MVHHEEKRGQEAGLTPSLYLRLVGQAAKTPASHAGNAGSIPARVTMYITA